MVKLTKNVIINWNTSTFKGFNGNNNSYYIFVLIKWNNIIFSNNFSKIVLLINTILTCTKYNPSWFSFLGTYNMKSRGVTALSLLILIVCILNITKEVVQVCNSNFYDHTIHSLIDCISFPKSLPCFVMYWWLVTVMKVPVITIIIMSIVTVKMLMIITLWDLWIFMNYILLCEIGLNDGDDNLTLMMMIIWWLWWWRR